MSYGYAYSFKYSTRPGTPAADMDGQVPDAVKTYKKLVDDGLASTLGAGLEMEKLVMGYANRGVSGDMIGQRRKGVQARGKSQL